MSTRNLNKVIQKSKKNRRIEELIPSQKGAMNKFIKIDKKNELENIGGCFLMNKIITM